MAAGTIESDLRAVLLQHDTHINNLNGRIGHVEKTLGEHGTVLQEIKTAVTKQDARPTFNVHQSVTTVLSLAILFSMVVGGIIWVTQSQFSSVLAEQKGINSAIAKTLDKHEYRLDRQNERLMKTEEAIGRWSTSFASIKGGAR